MDAKSLMMMKYFFILIIFYSTNLFANTQSDSLAYQLQRKKINGMLDARSSKFGLYAESLDARTGIFGFKTKKDMQKSIDILIEIIQTDNEILKETKTLLDYKTFEQEKVLNQSKESESRNLAYMRTINKLENDRERIKNELEATENSLHSYQVLFFLLLISTLGLGVFIYRKIYQNK
ncbi:hypothetical protein [Pedobacter glucosidilyticus]|uniref:hypothetical protein n=1 Tax=Pedobacter glucosidilyticus TaxID=1122941 RepID=UPI000420C0FF|nr:hypothetical protein [Pedobacter glucosidilyticus]